MGKYGGTILTGRENFALWDSNLQIELAAVRLKKFLRPDTCIAPVLIADANPSEKKNFDIILEEWEFQHAQAFKLIIQSVDNANKIAIQSCHTAYKAYETLRTRYGMKDTALLAQLLSQLFSVQLMKESSVTEKYDLIMSLSTQIESQQSKAKIPDIVQAVILMRSLPRDYDTALEILTNKDEFPTINDVFQATKATETRLNEPNDELEIVNAAVKQSGNHGKICWVCRGNHVKPQCPQWLASEEGKEFKNSGMKWRHWQERCKVKSEHVNAVKIKLDTNTVHLSDSETESEYSTYFCASTSNSVRKAWGVDSMCSCHLTPMKDAFISKISPAKVPIEVADGTTIYSEGRGDVRIFWKRSEASKHIQSTILRDVLYVPKASVNLISLGILSEKGLTFMCNDKDMLVYKDNKLMFRATRSNRVWIIPDISDIAHSSVSNADVLHEKLGHPGRHITSRIPHAVSGICSTQNLQYKFCRACKEAKMTRKVSREPMREVTKPLERVHIDLCGPFRTISLQGNRYMLTITDQFTKFKWSIFRSNKMQLVHYIKRWCTQVENDRIMCGKNERLRAIRFDKGTEFLNKEMKSWATEKGINLEPTVGYRPEANGIAERANRTIIEKGNAMRFRACLGPEFWELSFMTAVYLGNRQPIGGRQITPWTAWYGNVPNIDHYKIWGCTAYVHIPKSNRGKLDKRCWKGIFVGYKQNTSKIYYIWNPQKKELHEAQSVDFDEKSFNDDEFSSMSPDSNLPETYDSDSDDEDTLMSIANMRTQHTEINEPQNNQLEENINPNNDLALCDKHLRTRQIKHAEYMQNLEKQAIARGDRRSGRQRKPTEKAAEIQNAKQKSNAAIEFAFSTAQYENVDVPLTYEAALQTNQADRWKEAYESEMASLIEHGTFSAPLDNIPNAENAITAKIVLDLKRGEDNEIIRYKARLVARGFAQKHGVNYEETFAPTIRLDAFRIILAVAAKENWGIYQMDVVTAFLAGELEDEIYIKMPEHMVARFGRYARVLKSLYGLKQAARVWYLLLAEFLKSIGFSNIRTDQTIFTNPVSKVVIGIHVDDLLITGPSNLEAEKLKGQLKRRFKMKDLGNARNVLGIRITRKGDKLTIDQSQYAKCIVRDFAMPGTKVYSTPMASDAVSELVRSPGKPCTEEELLGFWRLLGKLMYLCNTRPDIIFATHKLAQFSHKACRNHWLALLRILSYIEGTIQYGITYGRKMRDIPYYKVEHNIEVYCGSSKEIEMVTFADADYAGDPSDRKSISGIVMMLNGGAVATVSKKQACVATSTTNAEYVAANEGAKLAIWGNVLLSRITGICKKPVPLLLGDNKACIQLQSGLSNTSKIKHLDVAYHHIVDEIENKNLESRWVSGVHMLADGLTKPLPGPAFYEKRAAIGVIDNTEADHSR